MKPGNQNAKKPDALRSVRKAFRLHPHACAWIALLANRSGSSESSVIWSAVQFFASHVLDAEDYSKESNRQALIDLTENRARLLRCGMSEAEFNDAISQLREANENTKV